jgi:hypothetical protein
MPRESLRHLKGVVPRAHRWLFDLLVAQAWGTFFRSQYVAVPRMLHTKACSLTNNYPSWNVTNMMIRNCLHRDDSCPYTVDCRKFKKVYVISILSIDKIWRLSPIHNSFLPSGNGDSHKLPSSTLIRMRIETTEKEYSTCY